MLRKIPKGDALFLAFIVAFVLPSFLKSFPEGESIPLFPTYPPRVNLNAENILNR